MNPADNPRVAPIPSRYWWLKRILLGSAAFVVFLIGLRLWWGWEAERRLQAEVARIIAAGEPIYPEDFNPKEKIPDEQNAARLYLDAQEAFSLTAEQTKAMEAVLSDASLVRDHFDALRSIVEDNADALRLARRARQLPQADWGLRFRSPVFTITRTAPASHIGERRLGKLLQVAAICRGFQGDKSGSVETLLDTVALGRALRRQPTYYAQLAAWAIDGGAIRGVEEMVLVSRPLAAESSHPAAPTQIRALLKVLCDDDAVADGMRRAWLAERMSHLDLVVEVSGGAASTNRFFGGPSGPPARLDLPWEVVYRPVFQLDMITVSQQTQRRVENVQKASYVRRAADRGSESVFDLVLHPCSSILSYSHDHSERMYFRHLAWRRLAATGLAARLFRAEHGHLPRTLDELVPEYLPRIPADPLAVDQRCIVYLPDADPPIVYSIGTDGVDDGGWYVLRGGLVDAYKMDFPFFLNGERVERRAERKSGESQETEEDADDGENAEGQDDEDQDGEEKPEGG